MSCAGVSLTRNSPPWIALVIGFSLLVFASGLKKSNLFSSSMQVIWVDELFINENVFLKI
jgi:hypothetical protein